VVGVVGVTGGVTQTGIELGFDGSARQFGSLRSSTMEIEVPQADGTLADIVFTVASVADYNLALSHLRSNVTAANTGVSTIGPPGTVTVTTTTTVPPTSPAIPVVGCPTTYGAGPPPARAAPEPQPVDLPTATAAQLGYYTTDTFGVSPVLAPRGWSCTALVAGDGSVNISVYPRAATPPLDGSSGQPAVVARSDSACQSCVWGTVCRFVPAAGAQLGYTDLTCPGPPAGETTHWIRGSSNDHPPLSEIVAFQDPTAPDPTNGIVLYNNNGQEGSASEDDCSLPGAQRFLCTAILNNFSAHTWLMN
jgi:hypothetical protein